LIASVLGEMAELYLDMGDRINHQKVKSKQQELLTRSLQAKEKDFEVKAREALKIKDFATAAKNFEELVQIANRLISFEMTEYQEKLKKYQLAVQECKKNIK